MIVSDGDNVNFCADRLQSLWQNSYRGDIPIGITLEPAMFKIFPTCLNYYYQSATENEYFLAGPSGAGYCFVDLNPAFPKYLDQTKYAMDQADMDQVWLLNGYEGYQIQYSDEIINAYTSKECDFTGIYLNYHDFPAELNYVENEVPIFQSVFVEHENELVGKVQALRTANPNEPIFVFVGFWAWDFSFTRLKRADDQLNDNFVFLRPDHFSELFLEYQESQKDREIKEFFIFIVSGLIPLICTFLGLVYVLHKKKKNRSYNEEMEVLDNNDENYEPKEATTTPENKKERLSDNLKVISNKAIFLILNIQLLLIARICFYSTILNIIYFVILLISVYVGISLKKVLDRIFGIRNNLVMSLSMFSIGALLFYISPGFIIFIGFSIGILFHHQIQSSSNLFESRSSSRRPFIYLLVLASALILLCPPEYYLSLFLITTIFSAIFSGLGIYFLTKGNTRVNNSVFQLKKSKFWYPRAVIFGVFLFLLLVPTFSSENVFYHVFWGANNFPSRLTIGFNLAATYLGAIILTEFIRIKEIEISDRIVYILLISGLISYIILPLFLSGMYFLILSNFIFIFGILNFCIYYFDKNIEIIILDSDGMLRERQKGSRGFIGQSLSWLLIGLFLMFVPPPIIIADIKGIFVKIEITTINQLIWPAFMYWLFYVPGFRMLLIIPITILLLIYGAIQLLATFYIENII